jgi:hypothetical protein
MSEPHLVVRSANNTTPVVLVEARTSGVLKGIGVAGGSAYHNLRVSIDGRELGGGFLSGIVGGGAYGNNGLPCDLPFESQLLIEAWDETVPCPQTLYWVSYTTDGAAIPGLREQTQYGDVVYRYLTGGYELEGAEGYRVLLGAEKESRISLDPDFFLTRDGGGLITGQITLTSFDQEPLFEEEVTLGIRPVGHGFFVLIGAWAVEGSAQFSLPAEVVTGLLDRMYGVRPGCLELIANLPGYANFPVLLP